MGRQPKKLVHPTRTPRFASSQLRRLLGDGGGQLGWPHHPAPYYAVMSAWLTAKAVSAPALPFFLPQGKVSASCDQLSGSFPIFHRVCSGGLVGQP
jgi:hypothetical protein